QGQNKLGELAHCLKLHVLAAFHFRFCPIFVRFCGTLAPRQSQSPPSRDLVNELSPPREVSMLLTHCTHELRQNQRAYQTEPNFVHSKLLRLHVVTLVIHKFAGLTCALLGIQSQLEQTKGMRKLWLVFLPFLLA